LLAVIQGDEFRRAFESVPDAQLLLDSAGVVVAVSEGYLRATGSTRDAIVGNALRLLPPYASAPTGAALLEQTLALVQRHRFAGAGDIPDAQPCASGALFTRASSAPVLDDGERVTHILHRLEAVPQKLGTETDRERRFRKLVEYNYDAVLLGDERGQVTFASPSIERVTGYTPEEFLARPTAADLHPEDAARISEHVRRILSQPGGVGVTRLRRRHRDGSYRNVELTMVNYLHDPDVNSVVLNLRDVTEHVALEDELRRSSEQLHLAMSAAKAVSWDRDIVAGRASYSTDFAEFFGLPAGDYQGRETAAAVHPDDIRAVREGVTQALAGTGDVCIDFRGPERGRDTRWYSSRGRVIADEKGSLVRQIGVTWDITESRKVEEAQRALEQNLQESQKLESLGVLAGGIAHDFNNLLTSIIGNTSLMMEEEGIDRDALEQLQQVDVAARRAAALCKQMLAYAGKASLELANTNLNALIEETTHLLRVSISKKAELRFSLHPALPSIAADVTQIQQVMMNLIVNASDAIGNAGGTIAVGTGVVRADRAYLDQSFLSPHIPEGDYVTVEVSDSGPGMPMDVQSRIFEPFFSTKGQGRGLGLAAVLGIVRGHGGALRLYSEPGKGTTFKLLFPVSQDEPSPSEPADSLLHPLSCAGSLLLVEDEEALRAVATRMITKLGIDVLVAGDGREAVTVYESHQDEIAGVLMDLTMPRMNGEEALRELLRINPRVRVLLMSGYSKHDDAERLATEGLVGFIQKPFNLRELRKALQRLLG
jgi:PAS domain S-box-containing protein